MTCASSQDPLALSPGSPAPTYLIDVLVGLDEVHGEFTQWGRGRVPEGQGKPPRQEPHIRQYLLGKVRGGHQGQAFVSNLKREN